MDDTHSTCGSGYINVDLQPPSPRDAVFDYPIAGSPYSDFSDLAPVFDPYDPADFDAPHSANSLLMFDQYYRTPSPVNSDDHASSASHSPSMPVLEGLSFSSPAWQTEPLPKAPSPAWPPEPLPKAPSPAWQPEPLPKAPSPPRLLIEQQPGIVINAPDDPTDHGPQLHIVPATPVSGRGDGASMPSSTPWIDAPAPSASSSRSPSPAVSSATTPAPSRSPSASPRPQQPPYLYPQPQPMRSRSKSEASLEHSSWDPAQQQQQQQLHPYPTNFGANFAFGTPTTDFLSPNTFQSAVQLRRTRSDSANARHRNSRSEDLHLDPYSSLLFPPSAHEGFIRQELQRQQFLSPSLVPAPPDPLPAPPRGHYRTASVGSRPRSERGASAAWDPALDLPASARPSPYPSPHASPRGRLVPLTNDDAFDFSAAAAAAAAQDGAAPIDDTTAGLPMTVSKPNVTTGRTANASQRRRKQEATFVCPVPGCGSTFTRSFNLKGHIRSHNEEKPFQCHWPGCGKGFARQHDCKRHEQLHTNYRPFNCEGCGKQFARMDALNRHLRSEGGAECVKQQEGGTPPEREPGAGAGAGGNGSGNGNGNGNNGNGKGGKGPAQYAAPTQQYTGGGGVVKKMEELAWGVPRFNVAL
ncbi:hypothetical protein C0993_005047 [Termitomyces sp. T159_Od127]|nr:hypothetical protein C0993_005047 [Termitomyces sp. T159_Od127]